MRIIHIFPIYIIYVAEGETITSVIYYNILRDLFTLILDRAKIY